MERPMPPNPPEPSPGREPANERPSDANRDPQVNLGGADAVQKTSAVGARASAEPSASVDRHAAIPAGRGFGTAGWIAIAVLVLVLVFYLSGVF
jgi:hypothetical protein